MDGLQCQGQILGYLKPEDGGKKAKDYLGNYPKIPEST